MAQIESESKASSGALKPKSTHTLSKGGPVGPLPEEQLDGLMNACLKNAVVKGGTGFGIGFLCSIFYLRRFWPPLFGASFGLGMAYKECERSLKTQTECKASEDRSNVKYGLM